MARSVEWTESASEDLAEAAAFISRDSATYAAAVIRELIAAGRSLTALAERGRVVPEYRDAAIRELFVRNYRLLYHINDGVVYVLRILHGSRLLPDHPPRAR